MVEVLVFTWACQAYHNASPLPRLGSWDQLCKKNLGRVAVVVVVQSESNVNVVDDRNTRMLEL